MKQQSMQTCEGILLDFGGTLDSDGEHWLDRFFDLYERVGLKIPQADIKRAFYAADEACNGDPSLAGLGLRPLMSHHVVACPEDAVTVDRSRSTEGLRARVVQKVPGADARPGARFLHRETRPISCVWRYPRGNEEARAMEMGDAYSSLVDEARILQTWMRLTDACDTGDAAELASAFEPECDHPYSPRGERSAAGTMNSVVRSRERSRAARTLRRSD